MKKQIISLAVLAISAAIAPAYGQIVVDLKTGKIVDLAPATPTTANLNFINPYFRVTIVANPGCTASPYRALVEMNFKPTSAPEMKRALVNVEYATATAAAPNLPSGWVTHIADDLANDGYGGGPGLDGVAEAHITNQALALYSEGIQAGAVDRLLYQELQLSGGTYRFEIANQFAAFGQPRTIVNSVQGKRIFSLPDAKGDTRVFVGLNRVTSNNPVRTGCGATRAVIQLEAN